MFTLSGVKMNRDSKTILDIERLSIPTDKFTVVLGHNGSGKSTLVSLLAGQQSADLGEVVLNERSVDRYGTKALAKEVAFLPQKLPASAGLTVTELVKLGRFPWRGLLGRWTDSDSRIIEESIQQTGIEPFADTLADHLSGGERQRAWVSMLLAQQSPVLILDEPTSALDVKHQYQLMALLSQLNREQGRGVIVILHDVNLALRYASHVVALKKGKVLFDGNIDLLADSDNLYQLYETSVELVPHPKPELSDYKVAIVCA